MSLCFCLWQEYIQRFYFPPRPQLPLWTPSSFTLLSQVVYIYSLSPPPICPPTLFKKTKKVIPQRLSLPCSFPGSEGQILKMIPVFSGQWLPSAHPGQKGPKCLSEARPWSLSVFSANKSSVQWPALEPLDENTNFNKTQMGNRDSLWGHWWPIFWENLEKPRSPREAHLWNKGSIYHLGKGFGGTTYRFQQHSQGCHEQSFSLRTGES